MDANLLIFLAFVIGSPVLLVVALDLIDLVRDWKHVPRR